MSGFGWQEIAVGVVVLAAAAWLLRRMRRAQRERAVCSSCPVGKLPRP
ncbi:MAG: FeoB-associated Cys-rich membrane protein [Candidatus Eisenbacteria bacterium]